MNQPILKSHSIYAAYNSEFDRKLVANRQSDHYNFKVGVLSKENSKAILRRLNSGGQDARRIADGYIPYGGCGEWRLIKFWQSSEVGPKPYPFDNKVFKKWAKGRFTNVQCVCFTTSINLEDIFCLTEKDIAQLDDILKIKNLKHLNDPLNYEIIQEVVKYISDVIQKEFVDLRIE
ncbi:hypothetical protein [Sphingomonas sp. PvP055]|uniref:hypothetical protein n=1 Tax=Sphingomonas sp. PvP055 TaxID=3156391 RepID=UPI00339121CE